MRLLIASIAALAAATCFTATASAAISHPFLSSIDGSGTPAGSLAPNGLAVDNSLVGATGEVYVADAASHVVDRFSSLGSYDCQITGRGTTSGTAVSASECDAASAGTPSGALGTLGVGIAVDAATGDVYVPDQTDGVIDRFDASGGYLSQAVVPANGKPAAVALDAAGDLLVVDATNKVVDKYDPSTSSWSTFASGTPSGGFGFQLQSVAVDRDPSSPSFGDVYVADSFPNKVVDVFSATGTFLRRLTGTPSGAFGNTLSVAVDPTSGDLYVAEGNGSHLLDQFSASGAFEGQVQVPAAPFAASPVAVAIDAATGNLYVSDGRNGVVDVFGPGEIVPDVTTGAATGVGPTAARLGGTVNPAGVQVTDCRIEWGATSSYGLSAQCVRDDDGATDIGAGTSPVPVHADLTGLAPGTTYHFRVVASNANETVDGADATFSTPPPPTIGGAEATNLSASSADLSVKINPQGNDTTYHIEWGTSTGYGSKVPVPDADVGSGTSGVTVTQHLTGLSANTTYHWRIVAQNIAGTTTSVDHTFTYSTSGGGLPDNRAYELVTPPQKNGALLGYGFPILTGDVSDDGSRLVAHSIQCFAGSESCSAVRQSVGQPYAFTRTPSGWRATALAPPAPAIGAPTDFGAVADTGAALFSAPTAPAGEDDWYVRRGDGSLSDIGPAYPPAAGALGYPGPSIAYAATPDYSHLVYQLQEGSEFWPFDGTHRTDTSSEANSSTTYEYVGTGNSQPILVGVSGGRGSTDLISICGTRPASSGTTPGSISVDGATVYFIAEGCSSGSGANAGVPVPADELYAHIGESRTVLISGRSVADCTTLACASSPAEAASFEAASEDGSKALFTSAQQLTDDATQGSDNLYEYDFTRPVGHELTDLSAGDTSGGGPGVQGVVAQSADGSHAYFVATGVLTGAPNAAGQTATPGASNLYAFERDAAHPAGLLAFVATLPPADSNLVANARFNVTPEGRFLVFASHGALTPDDTSVTGAAQVFRYDARTGRLLRLSIGEKGFNDNGNVGDASLCAGQQFECVGDAALAPVTANTNAFIAGSRRDSTMSDDGAYVFFQSPIALTPQALDRVTLPKVEGTQHTQGELAQNVYEYHDGHVSLISDGRDSSQTAFKSSVRLLGADATGSNVFFSTADSLVPQDTGTGLDYYDARICTASDPCIAPSPPAAGCVDDACQGTPASRPSEPVSGTSRFFGSGNAGRNGAGRRKCGKHKRRRHGRCVRKRAHRGHERLKHGKCVSGKAHGKRKSLAHRKCVKKHGRSHRISRRTNANRGGAK